ncbi:MAG TPA: protein kinase, partial [Polyangiaceae bacterium]
GETLSSRLSRVGQMSPHLLAPLMVQLLQGLAAAHNAGILHRDLKPDNIFVSPAGHAKVLDFGIAKLQPNIAAVQAGTSTGSLLGTPHYMSPEQALGQTVDARSDLYAMGVILYEVLTGRRPFDAPTLYELLRQQVELDPPPPSTLRPDLPPALQTVIAKALSKNPALRFQTSAEFAQALESGAPVTLGGAASSGRGSVSLPDAQAWAAPSLATNIRAPGLALGRPPPTPASYSHDQSIARAAKSKGSVAAALSVGCLGIVVLGAVGTGAFLFLGNRAATKEPPTAGVPTNPASDTEAPDEVDPTTPAAFTQAAAPVDLKNFSVGGFLPKAIEMAKQHYGDARFVRLDAMGVNKRGIVDMSAQSSNTVMYRFRSPSASLPPKDFPENAEFESNCMVYVIVSQQGVMSYILDKWTCEMEFVDPPKCSPEQAWAEAERRGAPSGNLVGTVWFEAGPGGKGRWNVTIPPSFSAFIPDTCG